MCSFAETLAFIFGECPTENKPYWIARWPFYKLLQSTARVSELQEAHHSLRNEFAVFPFVCVYF